MSELDVICDMSMKDLEAVPDAIISMSHLKMLYLDRNFITTLPEDMFDRLPNLSWLDLRDNKLVELPKSIANHKYLENLLLQNNKITRLPNELGFVPKLKVLQLSENPLIYPPQDIVNQGIDDIIVFLQQEEHKLTGKSPTSPNPNHTTEKNLSSASSSVFLQTPNNRTDSGTLKLEILPTVLEQNLSKRILTQRQSYLDGKCNRDKVHRLIKSPSKTSVHSYYKHMNVRDYVPTENKMNAEEIKLMWLAKLKELISDQERILQQEKSMNALKNWRKEQSCSLNRKKSQSKARIETLEAPYDTDAVFNAYMTRSDPTDAVNQALVDSKPKFNKTDVDAVIQDVMAQLTKAKETMMESSDPNERIRNAEHELQLIVGLHKKIASIQKSNFI